MAVLLALCVAFLVLYRSDGAPTEAMVSSPGTVAPGGFRRAIVDRAGAVLAYSEPGGSGYQRRYPYDPLMTPVVGFVDVYTGKGLNGIEFQYDSLLRYDAPSSLARQVMAPLDHQEAGSIPLTIERMVQVKAARALARAARHYRAPAGCIVVMDPEDGAVLALAQVPAVRAGRFWEEPDAAGPSLAAGLYFRPLAIAAAMLEREEHPAPPRLPSWHSVSATTSLLTKGGDLDRMDGQPSLSLVAALGFGQKTGIDLPGEREGCIDSTSSRGLELLNNIKATPLQILKAYAMLENGGKPVTPHLLLRPDGTESSGGDGARQRTSWSYVGALYENATGDEQLTFVGKAGTSGRSLVFVLALDKIKRRKSGAASIMNLVKGALDLALSLPRLDRSGIMALYSGGRE